MFIQETQAIINAFQRRIVDTDAVSSPYDFYDVHAYEGEHGITVRFTIEDYYLDAYFDKTNEFHVENYMKESIFDYAEENEWSEADINFMKYGRR